MSNLHKNLTDAQIHVPKGFATAANDTTLQKDSSGNLVWAAASGGGGGLVTSLTTTGTSGAATLSGAGVLNVPNYSDANTHFVSTNIEAYGGIEAGIEWGLGSASGNLEHKFVTNLGSPPVSGVSPQQMVVGSVWCNTQAGATLKAWSGWIFGNNGNMVVLSLLRARLACPIEGEYPEVVPICRTKTISLALTGNTTPICFNETAFSECEGFETTLNVNEVLMMTAYVAEGEAANFTMNCNIKLGF